MKRKDPNAQALGRKGGIARKKKTTPEQRTEIATIASQAAAFDRCVRAQLVTTGVAKVQERLSGICHDIVDELIRNGAPKAVYQPYLDWAERFRS